jgi:hydroxymethylbilane synthase
MRRVVFGIRKSRLARAQLDEFIAYAAKSGVKMDCAIKTITAKGDRHRDIPIEELGQGIFIKELERELLSGGIDCAVHSLKDMPTDIAHGTLLASFPPRGDERDCLICRDGIAPHQLKGARVAIGCPRRRAFMIEREPDIGILPLRGNVDTRMDKLEKGDFDAMILAACGLKRIGYGGRISEYLDPDAFVPAAGQGAICAQSREDDKELNKILRNPSCYDTVNAVTSERKVLKELGIGCRMPFGVFARFEKDKFYITAKACVSQKASCIYYKMEGHRAEYEKITDILIDRLKNEMSNAKT